MKISIFLTGSKECKYYSKLASIISNNNPISFSPHITLATLNLSQKRDEEIENIINLSKNLASQIGVESFNLNLTKLAHGTTFFQSIFLECDPSNQILQKARMNAESIFKPMIQQVKKIKNLLLKKKKMIGKKKYIERDYFILISLCIMEMKMDIKKK